MALYLGVKAFGFHDDDDDAAGIVRAMTTTTMRLVVATRSVDQPPFLSTIAVFTITFNAICTP